MSVVVSEYKFEEGKRALLKKSSKALDKEVYGIGCDHSWANIFSRFLALDVLACPDGLTQDQVDCLVIKVYKNC
jgi:hypothetical protein